MPNRGIVRAANPIPNQLEKPSVNELRGGKFIPTARCLICQKQCTAIWVSIGTLKDISGIDANVMMAYPRYQSSLRRHSPAFDVRLEEVCVSPDKFRARFIAAVFEEFGSTDQCRDMSCER